MAMIDYGALLRVDGKLINKGKFFMDASDTGYICDKAYYSKYDFEMDIYGNYFVYAGDEELLICFYKCQCLVISHNKVIKSTWSIPFISETFFLPNNVNLTISHLDKELRIEPLITYSNWEDYVRSHFSDYILEHADDYNFKYEKKWFKEMMNKARICKNISYKYRSQRYLAEWNYKGKHYEVIFGYGIDSDKECWDKIKNRYEYDFSNTERNIIDEWFKEDK